MCRKSIYIICLVLLAGPLDVPFTLPGRNILAGQASWQPPDTVSYDDGKPLRTDVNPYALFAVRFTPAKPFTLYCAYLMFRNDYNASDGASLWISQSSGGLPAWPATFVGQVPPPLTNQTWIQLDLAGPMYFENDFFIIVQQKGGYSPGPGFWIGIDYGTTTGRTLKSYNTGQAWLDEPLGDALIRAGGLYGYSPCSPAAVYPPDGAAGIPTTIQLRWTPCSLAAAQDLYLGTDLNAVLTAQPGSAQYVARLPATAAAYNPGTLKPCTGYYWRIDPVPCPTCPPTKGPVWSLRPTCNTPIVLQQAEETCSTIATSDPNEHIRGDELADYVCQQILKRKESGGGVKDVKIITNACFGQGLLNDFNEVFGPNGACAGIRWVGGAASQADQIAKNWDDEAIESAAKLGQTIGAPFTDALAGAKAKPTDPAGKEKGTVRDRATDNVKEDLEKAGQLDDAGPNGSKEENPVVAYGNGGDKIKWHEGPGHKHEAVLFGNNKDDKSVRNNLKNMEDALKEVWPQGSHTIRKLEAGTTQDLKDAIAKACERLDPNTELVLYFGGHGDTDVCYDWLDSNPLTLAYSVPLQAEFLLHAGWYAGFEAMDSQGHLPTPTLNLRLTAPAYGDDWTILLNRSQIPLPLCRLEPGYYRLAVDWTCIHAGRNDLRIFTTRPDASLKLAALELSSGPVVSKTGFPACTPPPADLNRDYIVDFRDLAILAGDWLDVSCIIVPITPPTD